MAEVVHDPETERYIKGLYFDYTYESFYLWNVLREKEENIYEIICYTISWEACNWTKI